MEDFTNTREEPHHQELPDQVSEQALKEPAPPASPHNSLSPRSLSTPASVPCSAPGGPAAPPAGENNAKRSAVANGQSPSSSSSSSVLARHMPREVPPRFRQQQEPKTLLKRGQPLGPDTTSPLHTGELLTLNPTPSSDADVDLASPVSSLPSAPSAYANSTWGLGLGGPTLTQGMDKVVVDGSDLEAWPSIADSQRQEEPGGGGGGGGGCQWGGSGQGKQWAGSFTLNEYAASSQAESGMLDQAFGSKPPVWGVTSGEKEEPSSSKSDVRPADAWPTTDMDGITATDSDRGSLETSNESAFASLNPGSALTDERPERVAGPKQKGAEFVRDAGEETQLPTSVDLTPAVSRTEGWSGRADSAEVRGTWGICGASQGGGLKEQAATFQAENSASLQDSDSTNKTASDNQKGTDDWEGSECGSSNDDANAQTRSPASGTNRTEVALKSVLSRSDLDPRVLCNTGWGQTQIKQGVAWDLDTESGGWKDSKSPGRSSHPNPRGQGQGWGGESSGWGEQREEGGRGRKEGEWCSQRDQSGTGWGEATDDQTGRWGESKRDSGRWEQGGGADQWGQDERTWGEDGRKRGWVGKGEWGDAHHVPNNQTAPKGPNQQQQQPQSQSQSTQARSSPETTARPADPAAQNQSSGWTSGPIPQVPSAAEPSGWEEPSPQSISRKMEIDDGTAAWGDPLHYASKAVNMWDKTARTGPAPASRDKNKAGAWEQGGGTPDDVGDGSATWGKSFDAPSGWRDPEEPGKVTGWGGNPAKSGSKSMQDNWGEDGSNTSRHASWEEEDGGGGGGGAVWGGRGQQGSASSYSSGGWGQGQGGKRGGAKGPLKGNGGDSWSGPVTRQFSNMGIGQDEEAGTGPSDRPRRGISDYNGEARKRGGGGGGPSRTPQSSKEMGPGEAGPHFDKFGPMRGMQQPGVHSMNPSPGIRAQVPHQFLPPQVSGSMLKLMAPPGGGMFPPQHLLGGFPPQMQQFQLACQLLLQQQQQQQHFLSQRKFPPPPPLRQQHDPQQLARIMALLQQQKQQQGVGGPKLSPPHLSSGPKPGDGPLLHPAMSGPLADMQPKTPPSFPGYGSGVELESMMGGSVGGLKDAGGSQSRFKWMMEAGHPLAPSPSDPMLQKNGLLPGPVKLRGNSPYPQYDLLGAEHLGVTDTWHRNPGGKLGSATGTPTWPPEFQPGVPWKGVQSPEPEPYISPSGMLESPILTDTDHQLLQDHTAESNPSLNTLLPSPGAWPYSASDSPITPHSAKLSDFKSSWPPEPIGHSKSWRTNRNSSHLSRPPPGLTNQKQSSTSPWSGAGPRTPRGWGPGARSQDSPFATETAWSGGAAAGSSWLLLSNLTPQIDGSTLRTICLQHGPLMTFHLGLTQGNALIRYCSPHEAAKAQTALHMCVLGNTTILAEFVSEEEVARYFTHSQSQGGVASPDASPVPVPERERERVGPGPAGGGGVVEGGMAWQGLDVSAGFGQWSGGGGEEGQGGGAVWGGVAPGYHGGSLWGNPQMEDGASGLLPGDLLGGGADAL